MPRALPYVLLLCIACSDKPRPNVPRDAVRSFGKALSEFDYESARPYVVGDEADLEHFAAFLEFGRASIAFKEKFFEAYGYEGWVIFNDNEEASISVVQIKDLSHFDAMRYEVDGDRAVGMLPNDPQKLHLERSDGVWRVRLRESMAVPEKQLRSDAALYRALAAAIRDRTPRIGQAGAGPDVLDAELGAAMEEIFRTHGRLG